jgi:hypothetical protein
MTIQFDGVKFKKARNVVAYRQEGPKAAYLLFGKVAKMGSFEGETVRTVCGRLLAVLPIPLKGHSLTNKAYGVDGKTYLCKDTVCFVS